jgi:hypothetical protein
MADATKMEPKEIEKRLLRQYEEDKYGKLHRKEGKQNP